MQLPERINRGVDFIEAVADVELKELNLYNPDESNTEGKLIPKKLHGVLAIQVELKCGGIVIGCMFDHRAADEYLANMFISSSAGIARSETPSMLPSFQRFILNPRSSNPLGSKQWFVTMEHLAKKAPTAV
ncbi:hypothetical protein L1987_87099 [Smallanthus sonchifolius]|nr:hypothetical protein L1987_87099 [Smallanthus sonchifolius]